MTRLLAALGGLLVLALGSHAAAQESSGYRKEAVDRHLHGTVVGIAVRIPAGSMHDPEGQEGTAWVLARSLETQAVETLGPSTEVRISVLRTHTLVQLTTLPSEWARAADALDRLLFTSGLDPDVTEQQRLRLIRGLTFELGSPVADFRKEAAVILAEPDPAWARPPRGTPESLDRVDPPTLDAYRERYYRRDQSARAIVGPSAALPPEDTSTVEPLADSAAAEPPLAAPDTVATGSAAAEPPPSPARDIAWVTGYRREITEDVTNSWITVAYPAPTDLPRTHLDFIAHLLREELDPVPPDPDRYGVDIRVVEAARGPVLVVEASVFPEAADRWEERILAAAQGLATAPVPEEFFHWRRRRFRAARLLSEVEPEVEAARIAADLLRTGVPRSLGPEIWSLDAHTVMEAASSLGEPRVLRVGPDLGQQRGGAR